MSIQPLVKQDFVVVDEDATIAEMIGKLKQYEKHVALVFRKKKYLGLVEKKPLLRARLDPSETKVRNYVQRTPLLLESAEAIESASVMYRSNLDVLPVERNKQIVGILDGVDLAGQALQSPQLKKALVAEVKLAKPAKIDNDEPVAVALDLLYKERLDHLPIYHQGKLFGILSYKDILRKYLSWTPRRDFSARFNKAVMSKGGEADLPALAQLPVSAVSTNENLITTKKGSLLLEAVELMRRNKVHDVVVTAGDEVLGVLTIKNVLRWISSQQVSPSFNLQFVGLSALNLDEIQKANLQKITSTEALKLQRKIKNEFTLVVHLKEYAQAAEERKGKEKRVQGQTQKEQRSGGKGGRRNRKRSEWEGKGSFTARGDTITGGAAIGEKSAQGTTLPHTEKQHKFSVHLRVEYPGQILTVAQDDWDLETALHKTFDNAQNALEKKFKTYAIRGIRKKRW